MSQKYDWINYKVVLKNLDEKVRFILQFEKWIRKWKEAGAIDSFHFKIHHHQLCARIRLLLIGDRHESLTEELRDQLKEFGGEDILNRSFEVSHDKENVGWIDHVTWKILEHNTEILFVLINEYGKDYQKYLREKYWTGNFDMIHLLLNQLGMSEYDNAMELLNLLLGYYGIALPNKEALKFRFAFLKGKRNDEKH